MALGNQLTSQKVQTKINTELKAESDELIILNIPSLSFKVNFLDAQDVKIVEISGKRMLSVLEVNLTLTIIDMNRVEDLFISEKCYWSSAR